MKDIHGLAVDRMVRRLGVKQTVTEIVLRRLW
jgi:hypothetical protein